jgi:hypothetical protein
MSVACRIAYKLVTFFVNRMISHNYLVQRPNLEINARIKVMDRRVVSIYLNSMNLSP